MAQVRDAAFHPSSPHSSSGGADSYKNEGTPETRLTIFSPDDGAARANKMTVLGPGGPSDHAANYHHVNAIEGFGEHAATAEKDPFISSATPFKGEQKLSPTASAFRPVSVPLVARGSLSGPPGLNAALGANRQLFSPQGAARFSNELGVSRCIVFYSHSKPLTINDVEGYIAVSHPTDSSPSPLDVQTTDNRHRSWSDLDLRATASGMSLPPTEKSSSTSPTSGTPAMPMTMLSWARPTGAPSTSRRPCSTTYVSVLLMSLKLFAYVADTQQVCGSPDQADPICNGQIQIMAFAQGANVSAAHVETVVHTFLETQGEVFAIMRQNDSHDGAFHAVVEFSDADVAITVVHRFNGTTLGVSTLPPSHHGCSESH